MAGDDPQARERTALARLLEVDPAERGRWIEEEFASEPELRSRLFALLEAMD